MSFVFLTQVKKTIMEKCPELEHMQPSKFQRRSHYLISTNVCCRDHFRVIKEKIKTIQEKLDPSSLEYIFKLK